MHTPGFRWALAVLMAGIAVSSARAQQQVQPERLTLKQAVSLALQKDPDLSLARLQYEASQRDVGLNRSRFLPNLYTGSGAAYTSGFPLVAGGGAPAVFSLSYEQALFDRPASGELHAAEQRAEQQQLSVDAMRNTVIVRAASAYLDLAKVRRELDLLRRERESAQKILDFTKQRSDAGFELPIEVTKAQLTSARVEQRLAQLEDQEDSLADQLRGQLGLASDQPIEVVAEDIPPAADQTASDLVAQALRSNIEIKQAESERAASEAHLQGERGGYWPAISIIGQYNVLAKFNNYDLFFNKFQRNNVIFGADIKIPLFASRTSAAVASAKANLTASAMAVENMRTQVSLDVRHKAHQTRETDTGREVARLELDLAQQNLQVLQSQYTQGRASVRDVENAQLDENDKWVAFLDADFAKQQAPTRPIAKHRSGGATISVRERQRRWRAFPRATRRDGRHGTDKAPIRRRAKLPRSGSHAGKFGREK